MCQNVVVLAKQSQNRAVTICKHHIIFVYWDNLIAYFYQEQFERLALHCSQSISGGSMEERATAEIAMGAAIWQLPTADFYQLSTLILTAANQLTQMQVPQPVTQQRLRLRTNRFSVN